MASLGEKMGRVKPRSVMQTDELDGETRAALWNAHHVFRIRIANSARNIDVERRMMMRVWLTRMSGLIDEFSARHVSDLFKSAFMKGDWVDALDNLDATVAAVEDLDRSVADAFRAQMNQLFEKYMVPARYVNGELEPLDNEHAVSAIENALDDATPLARKHLDRALAILANRERPQYANVVAESISAVESTVRQLTGQRTLGDALKALEDRGVNIHPALRGAWDKLYGWTSDAAGIRHGAVRSEEVDQAMAVYMLVSCSAFVSLLQEAARNAQK